MTLAVKVELNPNTTSQQPNHILYVEITLFYVLSGTLELSVGTSKCKKYFCILAAKTRAGPDTDGPVGKTAAAGTTACKSSAADVSTTGFLAV